MLLFETLDRQLQADAHMPHGYYEILVRLSEADGWALRMSELAASTRSSRSRLSHAVARLEDRGWVRRCAAEGDRRGHSAERPLLETEEVPDAAVVRRDRIGATREWQAVAVHTSHESRLDGST